MATTFKQFVTRTCRCRLGRVLVAAALVLAGYVAGGALNQSPEPTSAPASGIRTAVVGQPHGYRPADAAAVADSLVESGAATLGLDGAVVIDVAPVLPAPPPPAAPVRPADAVLSL